MIRETQNLIDRVKLADSQRLGKDMCGEYFFCKYCKKEKENPCAKACKRMVEETNKPTQNINEKKPKNKAKLNGKEFRATVVNKD